MLGRHEEAKAKFEQALQIRFAFQSSEHIMYVRAYIFLQGGNIWV